MEFDAEIKRLEDGINQLQQNLLIAQGALLQTKALKLKYEEEQKDKQEK